MNRHRSSLAFAFRVSAVLVPLLILWASPALASPSFPAAIQDHLGMTCAPPCTICHRDNNGGTTTAIKPFVTPMLLNGLAPARPSTVPIALDALEMAGDDTDGDGTPDVTELRDNRDPNVVGDDAIQCRPLYGCGARIAPQQAHFDATAAMASVLTLAWLAFRARKR